MSIACRFILGENSEIEGAVKAEDVLIRGRLIGSVHGHRIMLHSVGEDLLHKTKTASYCKRTTTVAGGAPKAVHDLRAKLTGVG
jgi:hypothetical protein